ncbi:MAG: phosphoenolpyruvate carboxykinase (GTP), partial [Burkholderiaceae bacterium]|nr:phosphoenolpyruvate carboxykinase (GTP) [Burkholderiaceae bacterium]
LSQQQFDLLTAVDKEAWRAELALHGELFDKLKHHLPQQLADTKAKLEQRLSA